MLSFPSRCQHIKVNGTQCGCPALRRNKLCYFHKRHHDERLQLNADKARRRAPTIDLPVLEDANSIQVSLMQIMRLIVAGQIDGKTAGLLLYALQTASANLRHTNFNPFVHDVVLDPNSVGETQLRSHVWDDEDFRSDEEEDEDEGSSAEVMRAQALQRGQRRAREKAELERLSEAEADHIVAEGRREYEEKRQQARVQAAALAARSARIAATPAASSALPPLSPAPLATKRPQAKVDMNEVRKRVSAQIIKALPALAAAQAGRNGNTNSSA
jgi:hypothetical protein